MCPPSAETQQNGGNCICLPVKVGKNGLCVAVSQGIKGHGVCATGNQGDGSSGIAQGGNRVGRGGNGTGNNKQVKCTRKDIIKKIKTLMDSMEDGNLESRCCCIDTRKPPEGMKVVFPSTLDGETGRPETIPVQTGKVLWVPPPVDNRPIIDPSMSCYAATVSNQFYDQYQGCRLDCDDQGGMEWCHVPHSHWWNDPSRGRASVTAGTRGPDHCEDRNFVAPQPAGHDAWSYEPGGLCRYPEYCKAACFDHTPERDWARGRQ